MAGCVTYVGDTQQMLDLKNHHTIKVAVGRTTAWADEGNPPDEDITTTDIDEIQGFKTPDVISLCKEDSNGSIEFSGKKYTLVDDADALSEQARWLYIKASLAYDQFPVVTYRQTAVYLDPVPAAGHESDDPLLPTNVTSNGVLRYYKNHPPIYRNAESVNVIEIVLELQGQNT